MTDYAFLTIAEAANLLKAREISPVEYTQALLDRIAKHDGTMNSFLHISGEHALDAAKTAEAEISAGDWRGPMHGVPYALKDIIDAAGEPTTCHSKVMVRNSVPDTDAHVTAQFRAAGAVLVGKTATHEFAIGGPSFDLPWPPARNPWNPAHFTGGSSSGSGAALAAGFVPAALGTDTGGSVRNPASLCGLVGMKATYGRVSRRGVFPLSFTLDHIGPMTRTVEDNAILLNVIAGHDAQDPGSAAVEKPDFTERLGRDIKGMRIGVIRHFFEKDLEADPEMAKSINDAVEVLRGLGAEVSDITLAPLDEYAATNRVILLPEAFAIHEKWFQERPEDYGELTRRRVMGGAFIRAADYVNATRVKARLVQEYNDAMRDFDVAITASSMDPACLIEDEEANERTYTRQARTPFNLTGAPAMSVPTGFSSSGLPLSMQIVGKAFDEAKIYQVAHAYERATDWTQRRPPMAA
jgi:aspartyl-tRNA(Asn)/glutamyl-tRNA(Gln) amidotransferase subunit A